MANGSQSVDALRAALISLLEAHPDLDENEVYRAFGEAVRARRDASAQPAPPPPSPARPVQRSAPAPAPTPSPVVRVAEPPPAPPQKAPRASIVEDGGNRMAAEQRDGRWQIWVEVTGHEQFMTFGQQLHRTGVYLTFPEPPPLNAAVDLCLILPITEDELWFEGRVVFSSAAGTAFDLKPSRPDHPQRWNRASVAFTSGASPKVSAPSMGPTTEPPRLAKSAPKRARSSSARPVATKASARTRSATSGPVRSRRETRSEAIVPAVTSSSGRSQPPASRPGTPKSRSVGSKSRPAASRSRPAGSKSRPAASGSRPTPPRSRAAAPGSRPAPQGSRSAGSTSRATGPKSRGVVSASRPASPSSRAGGSDPLRGGVASRSRQTRNTRGGGSSARPTPSNLPVPSLAKLLISLRNNAAKVGSADHYAMLGLHWSAYPQLIEEAYLREKWNVELEHYPETTSETDLESRERVSEALDQAYDMLHHPTSRRAYRETLVDKMNLESAVRLYREKGDTALMRNDPEAARDFFQRVVELAPKHRGARAKLEELGVDLS